MSSSPYVVRRKRKREATREEHEDDTHERKRRKSDRRHNWSERVRRSIASLQKWVCAASLHNSKDGPHLLPAEYEIDHVVALCNGGLDAIGNLQALCPLCHRRKTYYDMYPDEYERETGLSKYFRPGPLAPVSCRSN
jgi:5-methylcytosine-specific restriction endonuclease McrA